MYQDDAFIVRLGEMDAVLVMPQRAWSMSSMSVLPAVCMYVCMHVCMCIYMYMYIHTYINIHI
jgi:hypothetical protein